MYNSLSDDLRNKESLADFKTSIRAPGHIIQII